ncbi:hypothetical protein HPB48_018410 [Haemaphysalis longicornis]|uniref:Uncharacterized protein n=1 Tax=Haemaphysalis longicornis TaxID=44386 RepID=A0A9J6GCZ3_HAELO|nr:hypothetical protein HPB48_018410 [Haemaphysalis longicornis]
MRNLIALVGFQVKASKKNDILKHLHHSRSIKWNSAADALKLAKRLEANEHGRRDVDYWSRGMLSNGAEGPVTNGTEDAAVMPQPLLSPSYSPLPVANLLVPWEQPSPAVNLAAQRSVDPAGGDLPSASGDPRPFGSHGAFPSPPFLPIALQYFRMVTAASVQPCMFPPPVPGYNGSISVTIVPYVADPGFVVPDIHCTVPEATPMPNGGFPPEGA